jgi:hypothetical protein
MVFSVTTYNQAAARGFADGPRHKNMLAQFCSHSHAVTLPRGSCDPLA